MRSTNYSRKRRVSRKSMRGGRKSLRRRGRKSLRRKGRKSLRRGRRSLRGGMDHGPIKPYFNEEEETEYELLEKEEENAETCDTDTNGLNVGPEGIHNLDHDNFITMMQSGRWGKVAKKAESGSKSDSRDSKLIDYAKLGDSPPVNDATEERNQLIKTTIDNVLDKIIKPVTARSHKHDIPDGWNPDGWIMKTACDMDPVMLTSEDVDAVQKQCTLIKDMLQKKDEGVLFTETNFGWKIDHAKIGAVGKILATIRLPTLSGRTYLYSPYFKVKDKYYKIIIPDEHSKVNIGQNRRGTYKSNLRFQFIK